ncbi:MAG: S1 RNA-binding domain-containing protein [Polyangiaceae bacterium]
MATDNFASLMTTEGGSDRARKRLSRGEVLDATVMQIASDTVFVDVGTLTDGRIPRLELLDEEGKVRVAVGDRVRCTVVEARFDGSILKALGQAAPPGEAPRSNEVLAARVTRVEKFGVFVSTAKGEGLIPLRELPLPPGSDHRKLFPVGKEFPVVTLDVNAQGKLRFSATSVSRVQEEQNFRDFASGTVAPEPAEAAADAPKQAPKKAKPPETRGFGTMGDLMRERLGMAAPAPAKAKKPAPLGQRAPDGVNVIKRKR